MQTIATDAMTAWSVCVSVSVSTGHSSESHRMAELIEMLFEGSGHICMSPRTLDGGDR